MLSPTKRLPRNETTYHHHHDNNNNKNDNDNFMWVNLLYKLSHFQTKALDSRSTRFSLWSTNSFLYRIHKIAKLSVTIQQLCQLRMEDFRKPGLSGAAPHSIIWGIGNLKNTWFNLIMPTYLIKIEFNFDFLEITDPETSETTRLTGSKDTPTIIVSTGNRLNLRFTSDYSVTKRGFRIEFSGGRLRLSSFFAKFL